MKHQIPVPDVQTVDEAWADIKQHQTLQVVGDSVEWTEIDCEDAADCPYCHSPEGEQSELEGETA